METLKVYETPQITENGLVKLTLPSISDEELPTVSIVIPTYNRQEFDQLIIRNWELIDYPRDKLELIIVDDSENADNLLDSYCSENSNTKYIHEKTKVAIGEKRNLLCKYASNEYIVHMDSDDYYPSTSVVARIRMLLHFQQKIQKLGCFGCSKVICLDLFTNQMFEAFDSSVEGFPATLSESTMCYSKKYWETQQWDNTSKTAECLPFIKERHDTICTGPSVFVVVQFSHGTNTINRRVERTALSDFNAKQFNSSLTAYDSSIIETLRAKAIGQIPEYKQAIEFVKKYSSVNSSQLKSILKDNKPFYRNPLVIDLIRNKFTNKKHKSSGRDIVYYCGPGEYFKFNNPWNPKSKQLGGSEEAVINLSFELARMGWNVTVYCVLEGESKMYNGPNNQQVMYVDYHLWVPNNVPDVTIIWRDPSNCKYAKGTVFLDLHDAIPAYWLNELEKTTTVLVKSEYHKKIINKVEAIVIPNGIHPIRSTPKVKNLLVCTSSPDRCLRALLRALPIIRNKIPEARIHWAYGFKSGIIKGGMEEDPRLKEWVKESKELIANTPGFVDLGRLSQSAVNSLYAKASGYIYLTRFPEIDCISLTKAMAAGCIPLVTPAGAMSEKIGSSEQIAVTTVDNIDTSLESGEYFDNFVNNCITRLKESAITQIKTDSYLWTSVAERWNNTIKSKLSLKDN